jgi:hypothetical protein
LSEEYRSQKSIRRSFVASHHDDPLAQFICAMAWGFGPDARGLFRVRQMLLPSRDARPAVEVIEEIVKTVQEHGAAAGLSSLFVGGRARLRYLGIAFGTKLLHFAAVGAPVGPCPLVLDARVYRGAQGVTPRPPIPDPARYVRSSQYQEYCQWAHDQVEALQATQVTEPPSRPDQIEFLLFEAGGRKAVGTTT